MPPLPVAIVPHTHWDREWYEPYQTFRMNLVDAIDSLLDIMEADPSYARFLIDGQMAAVDDYLEVRPENEDRLRALAASGRLTMGPWYILMDEFLVGGETIVRDLQMGIARGAAFGGAMEVGYLPDMFGHIAQMPQILHLAGLDNTVVWRGVPSEITKTGFWWEAPDGTTIRAEYLPVGYGNGAVLPDDAKAFIRRTTDHLHEVGSFVIDRLLLMNGSDHLSPQPWLGKIVAEANALQDDYAFEISSLPEYLRNAPTESLQTWKGELRSGARANVLMGVTSNRVDVKRASAEAERQLLRRAEPFAALFMPAEQWPSRLFDLAWREVIRNAAHDSICACSVDDVVDAVLHRFAEARQIAQGIAARSLKSLTRSFSTSGRLVVNPSARPRSGMVELVLDAADVPDTDIQILSERSGLPGSMTFDSATIRTVLGMLQGPMIENDAWVQDIRIEEDDTGIDLTVVVGPEERPGVPIAEAKQDLYVRLGARPDVMVRVHLDQPRIIRIAARVDEVAGFGWRPFVPAPLAHPVRVEREGEDGPVTLTNDLVEVVVNPTDGTFSVDGIGGFGRLVDGGDHGDSYNYSPPLTDSTVDTPESVSVSLSKPGPVQAGAIITSTYRWPDRVDAGSMARVGEQPVVIVTTIEVRADERPVRVTTSFVNPSKDHRLRVHLPLPEPATSSEAECAFTTVERALTIEGRADELGLPTFPAQRFVTAGGLTVVHDRVTEYELIDIDGEASSAGDAGPRAHTLALTLLRSTGMLSRLGMTYRPFPAGPLKPVDGLQMLGRTIETRYALVLGDVDPWSFADDVLLPFEVIHASGGGDRPSTGCALSVTDAEVCAVHRVAGMLEVRVHNPRTEPVTVRVDGKSGWLVDLRGRPTESFDGSFELRPHGIATFRLPEV